MEPFEQFSQRIIPTEVFYELTDFQPDINGLYLFGSSDENRSSILLSHVTSNGLYSAYLEDGEGETFLLNYQEEIHPFGLYNQDEQDTIWEKLGAEIIYLDITGLSHHIWAVLIASAIRSQQHIRVLYVEPEEYSRSQDTANLYDLSNEYEAIKELPGYSMLQQPGANFCYIPLLGFEGARFSIATTAIDPPRTKVYPVVGLPGFRPEYPFEAYVANRRTLDSASDWVYSKVKYVDAGCPFCLFYAIQDLAIQNSLDILKIALLGTKPHALGAVLYALYNEGKVQLLYDFPKRKPGRTAGIGRIYLYHVTFFLSLLSASTE